MQDQHNRFLNSKSPTLNRKQDQEVRASIEEAKKNYTIEMRDRAAKKSSAHGSS